MTQRHARFWWRADRHGIIATLSLGKRELWFAVEGRSNILPQGFQAPRIDSRRRLFGRVRIGRVVIAGGVW